MVAGSPEGAGTGVRRAALALVLPRSLPATRPTPGARYFLLTQVCTAQDNARVHLTIFPVSGYYGISLFGNLNAAGLGSTSTVPLIKAVTVSSEVSSSYLFAGLAHRLMVSNDRAINWLGIIYG